MGKSKTLVNDSKKMEKNERIGIKFPVIKFGDGASTCPNCKREVPYNITYINGHCEPFPIVCPHCNTLMFIEVEDYEPTEEDYAIVYDDELAPRLDK